MKRLLSIYLLFLPLLALANTYTGTTGSCSWAYDTSTKVLTISGSGSMADYISSEEQPWRSYKWYIKTITIQSGVQSIGSHAFSSIYNVTSVTIPTSVKTIGDSAFYYDSSLTSITIPSGVKTIGDHAFSQCTNLGGTVTVPASVTSLGSHVFDGCSSLTSASIGSGVTTLKDDTFYGCSNLTSVSLPSGLTSIGGYAFFNCYKLSSVTIPSKVSVIGRYAFSGCSDLKSITIPSNVTTLSDGVFSGCIGLTYLTIPSNVNTIGEYALRYCYGLTSLSVPSKVTTIGSGAFQDCTGLTYIYLSSGITSLSKYTFSGCTKLSWITIPSGVTSILEYAFEDCTNLKNITIPSNVSTIKDGAFAGCSSLNNVTYLKEDARYLTLQSSVFEGIDSNCTLHVPCGSSDTYISKGWNEDVFGGGIYELGYAVYTENDNTLTFYYDSGAQDREGEVYSKVKRSSNSDLWGKHKADIKRVEFYPTFSQARPTSTSNWFNGCYNLEEIVGMEYLNTENVTTMYAMFNGTAKNTGAFYSLDLSNFNTAKVTDMRYMFNSCSAVHKIAISDSWTTSQVTKSDNMFNGCKSLVGGDGTKYSASYTDKTKAFAGTGGYLTMLSNEAQGYAVYCDNVLTFYCDEKAAIRKGDVYTNLVRKKKTDQWGEHNADIKKVVFDDSFYQYEATSTAHWFNGCVNLEEVEGTYNLYCYNTTSAYAMFNGCKNLREFDIGCFSGANLTNASYMFNSCSNLRIIWSSEGFYLTANKSDNMFTGCTKLVGYTLEGTTVPYNSSKTDIEMCNPYEGYITYSMLSKTYAAYSDGVLTFYCDNQFATRQGCDLYTNLLRKKKTDQWGVHNEEITKVVFDESIQYPTFNDEITSTAHWFNGCVNLESIEGLEYLNTESVTSMYAMFNGCKKLKQLNLYNLNTSNVKNMSYMFNGCSNLRLIYATIGNFDTQNVTKSEKMFYGCTKLVGYFELAECAYSPNNVDKSAADYAPSGYFSDCVMERTYAAYSDGVLSFHFDTGYAGSDADIYFNLVRTKKTDLWGAHNEEITKVVFEENFSNSWDISIESTAHWFNGCVNLTEIEGMENLVAYPSSTYAMFNGCSKLTSVDLSGLYTESTTNMSYMFNSCSKLATIYVSIGWMTSGVTKSTNMFNGCRVLKGDGGFKYNASYTDKTKAYGGGDGNGYLTLVERNDMAKNRDFAGSEATGIENVETELPLDGKVYSLSGRLIGTDIDIQTLPKGIYIVGGKKISVR